eukprot:comp22308_c0_seq1/m.33121 comp22308_c0_seq1/g.33121  ORF comp22308_c0_seq1/g.33121 comp22308_c0_seq1/m.33121 type:complete len:317 (-) comp22308_c0_seq1:525-1475(-)
MASVKGQARRGTIPASSSLHPLNNQRRRLAASPNSKFFDIKIIRPVVENGVKAFRQVGNMYLHFLKGLLVRQLEVFNTGVNPTRWAVRMLKEDDPQMFAFSVDSIGRFRSHEITPSEFAALWEEHTGRDGALATRNSPLMVEFTSKQPDTPEDYPVCSSVSRVGSTSDIMSARGSISSWSNALSRSSVDSRRTRASNSDMTSGSEGTHTPSPSLGGSHSSISSSDTPPPRPPKATIAQFTSGVQTTLNDELASDVHMIEMETIELGPARPPKAGDAAKYAEAMAGHNEAGSLLQRWSPFNNRKRLDESWAVGAASV